MVDLDGIRDTTSLDVTTRLIRVAEITSIDIGDCLEERAKQVDQGSDCAQCGTWIVQTWRKFVIPIESSIQKQGDTRKWFGKSTAMVMLLVLRRKATRPTHST